MLSLFHGCRLGPRSKFQRLQPESQPSSEECQGACTSALGPSAMDLYDRRVHILGREGFLFCGWFLLDIAVHTLAVVHCVQIRKHYCVAPCICPLCCPHLSNCRYYGYATYVTSVCWHWKDVWTLSGKWETLLCDIDKFLWREVGFSVRIHILYTHTLYYTVKSIKDMHSINKMDTSIPTIYSEKCPITEAKPSVWPITITCFCYHQLPRR